MLMLASNHHRAHGRLGDGTSVISGDPPRTTSNEETAMSKRARKRRDRKRKGANHGKKPNT
ncbi:MAG: hypothetical protein GEV00_19255 [Actinophytocola sp.]|nr:hypothetical protein [Actinophytocola sp.]